MQAFKCDRCGKFQEGGSYSKIYFTFGEENYCLELSRTPSYLPVPDFCAVCLAEVFEAGLKVLKEEVNNG